MSRHRCKYIPVRWHEPVLGSSLLEQGTRTQLPMSCHLNNTALASRRYCLVAGARFPGFPGLVFLESTRCWREREGASVSVVRKASEAGAGDAFRCLIRRGGRKPSQGKLADVPSRSPHCAIFSDSYINHPRPQVFPESTRCWREREGTSVSVVRKASAAGAGDAFRCLIRRRGRRPSQGKLTDAPSRSHHCAINSDSYRNPLAQVFHKSRSVIT